MIYKETIDRHIKEHKRLYKKKLNTLFAKVYDLIEQGEENITLELNSFYGGFGMSIKDYNSFLDGYSSVNTFNPEVYERLKDWFSFSEKELIERLDERITYIDNQIKMVVELKNKRKKL